MSRKTHKSFWLVLGLWFAGSLIITSISPQWTSAQSPDEPWATPLNLSHSGATTNPAIIRDSDGILHVVWQDGFGKFVYSQFVDDVWSPPVQTSLNTLFARLDSAAENPDSQEMLNTGSNPLFIASPSNYIYSVWITSQGTLFASRVSNSNFKDLAKWSLARVISYVAVSFTAAVDANGDLHVAYMKKADDASNPAGIYYIRTKGNGNTWGGETLLYETPYFNILERGEANLSIATGGTVESPLVLIAWDNRPRKQLFMAKSIDGGNTWDAPAQIAGPTRTMGEGGPFNVRVRAKENDVMLVWQSGQFEGVCTQYYGFSDDAGTSWDGPQKMVEGQPGCSQSIEFVSSPSVDLENPLFLLTVILDQIYLSAWNGHEWSEPQLQPILTKFQDPEIYNQVKISCLKTALAGDLLYAVGCDQSSEDDTGDIWLTSRRVDTISSWFSSHDWGQLLQVTSENLKITSMDLVATHDGMFHAFFTQPSDPSIYYTRWDGSVWSRFSSAWKVPEVEATWVAATTGPGDELLIIARSRKGALYFSRAKSSEAVNASGWSAPIQVKTSHEGRLSPMEVGRDEAGTIYIAYSIQVNDDRGVYLMYSADLGETWSEPTQVFDGAEAGFESIGPPSLYVSGNGKLAILWKQQLIQADGVPQALSLNVAISEDGGLTFNIAKQVVEAPVGWQDIGYDRQGNLHLIWREIGNTDSMWDQISRDNGRTWEDPLTFPVEEGSAVMLTDPNGRLNLIESGLRVLNHWLWDGSRWQAQESARWSLTSEDYGQVARLAASVTANGKMVIVMSALKSASVADEILLFFAKRKIELEPREIATQEAAAQVLATPTSTPIEPTPTAQGTLVSLQSPTEQTEPDDLVTVGMILLPVSFLLVNVIGIVIYKVIRSKAR